MDAQFKAPAKFNYFTYACMAIGLIAVVTGIITNPAIGWSSLLIGNYYFLSIALGAIFFLSLQYITQSGWSAMFKRIPEAMGSFVPVSGIIMLAIVIFGGSYIYHWTNGDAVANDAIIMHKSTYLNMPFLIIRLVICYALWFMMIRMFRKASLQEDSEGGLVFFNKSEVYAKAFIFILAVTFSFGTVDWIMSIDVHWYSTIFTLRNIVATLYHGSAVIALIVIILNKMGYFKQLNKYHLHDFSRYIYILGIIWIYFWFCEFLLIWYANLPEETVYYDLRLTGAWKGVFYSNIFFNWALPFLILLFIRFDRRKITVAIAAVSLVIGQFIDVYMQVAPGVNEGEFHLGFVEIGTFIGFIGLFGMLFVRSLGKAAIVPKNHPYLEESYYHQF